MEATKKCNRCGKEKPLSEFYGKQSRCKACTAAYMSEYNRRRSEQRATAKAEAEAQRRRQSGVISAPESPTVTIKIDAKTLISVKREVVERYGGTEAYVEHYRKRLSQFNPY